MTNADISKLYYLKVDENDVAWIINIFAEHCHYQRADSAYIGKDAIAKFYREERKIRGHHTLAGVIAIGDQVVCHGMFEGVGVYGQSKKVEFCDIWTFSNSLVIERRTYLALNSEYVRE